jgi:RNA polymerase sigma-70 factor (ECF subfamily)
LLSRSERLETLLDRIAGRDRAAFRELYDAVSAKLLGLTHRILRDRAQAEDALQETFLKIWHNAAAYDPASGRPIAWMAAIAHNTAIDAVRRRREVLSRTAEEGDELMASVVDPGSQGPDGADREALRRCLDGLDPAHRDCIVLAYCGGYSRQELAERFDKPVGTVKTWLHRGLALLKTCLGG